MTSISFKKPAKVGVFIRHKYNNFFLNRALKHIFASTFQDFHIYVLNDGGNEVNFKELANSYHSSADKRNCITFINNPVSVGVSGALCQLLNYASEELLHIHDSDDTIYPTFYESLINYLEEPKHRTYAGVVASNEDVIETYENGEWTVKGKTVDAGGARSNAIISLRDILSHKESILPTALLFRRTALEAALNTSGFPDPRQSNAEDKDLFAKLLLVGELGTVEEVLMSYFWHVENGKILNLSKGNNGYPQEENHIQRLNLDLRKAILSNNNLYMLSSLFSYIGAVASDTKSIQPQILNEIKGLQKVVAALVDLMHNITKQ